MPAAVDFNPKALLETLARHDVDFIVVGGLAGMVLGSSYPSFDLDIAYERSPTNLERLVAALRELKVTLRGAPEEVAFVLDARTLRAGANFTFDTSYGPLDILGDIAGAPPYEKLRADSVTGEIAGVGIRVSSIDHLIAMKDAAGRTKDKLMATEYRTLADEIRRRANER